MAILFAEAACAAGRAAISAYGF